MDRRKILYPRDYINTLNSKQRNCLEVLAIGSIIVPLPALRYFCTRFCRVDSQNALGGRFFVNAEIN